MQVWLVFCHIFKIYLIQLTDQSQGSNPAINKSNGFTIQSTKCGSLQYLLIIQYFFSILLYYLICNTVGVILRPMSVFDQVFDT